jgi:ureidoglycolate lyase
VAIKVEPISEAAFRPFGALASHVAGEPLHVVSAAFAHLPDATIPALEWVRPTVQVSLPIAVDRLERHTFSAQTFLPQGKSPFLVVVCGSAADGGPDALSARAFLVPDTVGVTFAAGIWHRSLAPLAPDTAYIMAMMRTGRDDDTEFCDLPAPFRVE